MINALRTRRVLVAILVMAVSLTVLLGSGPGEESDDSPISIPSDLVEVFGTNCEDQVIHIRLSSTDPTEAKYVETVTSDDCVVSVGAIETLSVAEVRERLGLTGTTNEGSQSAGVLPGSAANAQGSAADEIPLTNYHHSSHTISSPSSIDLAWHRIDYKRYWTDDAVWLDDPPNWPKYVTDSGTGTGPTWWILLSKSLSYDSHCKSTGNCSQAEVEGEATFHTDWLWCIPGGWQETTITTTNTSTAGGGYYMDTQRTGNCPGGHSVTAHWVDLSPTQ